MALKNIIMSIAVEESGIVIASLGCDFNDCQYVYPDSLRQMLAGGQFGADWQPVDAQCEELMQLAEDAGHHPEDIEWRAYSRKRANAGSAEYVYIVQDHRLMLRSASLTRVGPNAL